MEEGERHILTTGEASVIRDALTLVLGGIKSEGDLTPSTQERIEAFTREHWTRLILDLRTARDLPDGISPKVRNLRASHIGQVLVITGEVTSPEILHEIDVLRHTHSFPAHVSSGLRSVVHMLF